MWISGFVGICNIVGFVAQGTQIYTKAEKKERRERKKRISGGRGGEREYKKERVREKREFCV